jgi:hypothetical protein
MGMKRILCQPVECIVAVLQQKVAQCHSNDDVNASACNEDGCEKPSPVDSELHDRRRFERLHASNYAADEARKRQDPADHTNR